MQYELVVLVNKDTEQKAFTEKLTQLLQKAGLNVDSEIGWVKRVLAYPIKKQTEAIYISITLSGTNPNSLNEKFKLDQAILRHLVVKIKNPRKKKVKKAASN